MPKNHPFSRGVFLLTILFAVDLYAGSTLTGVVVDSDSLNSIPGAYVTVEGTSMSAQSDATGKFRLLDVPSGKTNLVVTSIGYNAFSLPLNLEDRTSTSIKVEMIPVYGEEVSVEAPFLESQASALNQQKTSVNIKNIVASDQIGRFPDPNAAEAVQRMPGVTLQRDQGEGRFVIVRGTEPRLTNVTINGERISAPEGDIRYVALDVIPADLLQAIEVTKALTPDMEADAIGGSVNLITKMAPQKTRYSLTAGAGYNDISDDGLYTVNGAYGTRVMDGALGLIFAGNYMNTDRGSDNFEPSYSDGDLGALEVRDYTINRKRYGMTSSIDYQASDRSDYFVRGIFSKFDDQEFRRTLISEVEDGELQREIKDRYESQIISSLVGGGRHLFANDYLVDYTASYSYSREEEPDAVYSVFTQEDVEFAPNVSPDSINPDNIQSNPLNQDISQYLFDEIVREDNFTSDRDVAFSSNLSVPFASEGSTSGMLKGGFKYRDKKKERDNEAFNYESEDDLFLVDFLDDGFDTTTVMDGQYDISGGFQNPDAMRNLLSSLSFERDPEADTGDYDATEKVFGAFVMTELNFASKLTFVPGFRYEHTEADYTGFQVLFNEDGDFTSRIPVSGNKSYGDFLPGFHAVYRLDENTNFRSAFTRTLSRPNFSDLSPYELVIQEDDEIERGNPDLDPTLAWNFDVLAEHYFKTVGVVSAGFFYKDITDNIFITRFDVEIDGEEFEVLQPVNGETANLYGFELAFQKNLRFLPAPLDGLGIYANYTYTDSEANFLGRTATLPGQSEHSGNLAISYEKYGFSGRVSFNFHGKYLEEVGESAEEDIFINDHVQMDLSASQRITSQMRAFVELINLNNEPFRRYEAIANRPVQFEEYSWWITFGVKFDY